MDDQALLRFSRHIMLPQIDVSGQQRIIEGSVLIVGVGGLGSPAAMYLAAAGVGRLHLADPDTVEISNLQRQIIHDTDDLGLSKVESARRTLAGLNPAAELSAIAERLTGARLGERVREVDVVVDASDNFETRLAINQACYEYGRPLVSGAAIRFEGQVSVFTPGRDDSPCYRCLYAGGGADETCTQNGVLGPLLGIIGSIQATEAIKLLAGIGTPLRGRVLLIDALRMDWQTMRLARDPRCPVCGTGSAQSVAADGA